MHMKHGPQCAVWLLSLASVQAHALGTLSFDSMGFLRSSSDRATMFNTLIVRPQLEGQSAWVDGKLNLQILGFLEDTSSFTFEANELYVATSRNLMPHHQFSFGRRQFDWNKADDTWKLGMWSPRFIWDPLRMEQIGLTGAFYTYESKLWRFIAYASPISVPERGYPINNKNGDLTSASPFHIRPPVATNALGASINTPIQYYIQYPSMSDILLRPAGAVQLRYAQPEGFWMSGGYGVMPIHPVDIVAQPLYVPQAGAIQTQLQPRFPMHHMLSVESGWRAPNWSLWGSVTGEVPTGADVPAGWMGTPMGPTLATAWGGDVQMDPTLQVRASYLLILESLSANSSSGSSLSLQGRFPYKRALNVGGTWAPGSQSVSYSASTIYDIENASAMFTVDITLRGKPKTWTLNLGSDLIVSNTGTGWIGQYQGDDRIRGRISYEF